MQGRRKELVVYVRLDCHLCEDMVDQLRGLQTENTFGLELRDVDTQTSWLSAYGEQVPILFADGVEICRYFLNLRAVQQVLESASEGK